MIVAIVLGSLSGILVAFFASKWLLEAISARFAERDDQRKWIKVIGGIFGAIALAPAIFFTIIAGGMLQSHHAGGGPGTVSPLVFGLAMIVVTTLTVAVTAATGAWFGLLIARNLGRGR